MGYFQHLRLSFFAFLLFCSSAFCQPAVQPLNRTEPLLGIGDVLRISVYQNPDLSVETRISETGQINFPLIGLIRVSGLTAYGAEQRLEKALKEGGFVLKPQVRIQVAQIRSNQISILGQVVKPGRYPIEVNGSKVSEMIAAAGGVVQGGADIVTLVGQREGQPIKMDIDLPAILQAGRDALDVSVQNGDVIYVDRAPIYYIYGEVQRPGQFRLERGMTLLQALVQGGGLTARGTERGIKVHRRDESGAVKVIDLKLHDLVERDDIIYVRESLF
jgi:polysaccharide export outer membrane protein